MPLWVCAQLQMEPLERDLGDLYGTDKTFIDIKLTNTGSQPVSILTVRTPHNVTYQYSNITIQSDSTEFIRFKIRPEKEGKFNYDFEVFFSHLAEVTVFNVKGNIIEMPSDFMTACPDFSSVGANRNYTAKIEVRVLDRNTGALIPGATVELFYPYGERQITKLPNGKKQLKLEQGYYFAVAGAKGYEMNDKGAYLNAKNNVLQIALDKAARNGEEGDSVSQDIREISFDEVVFDDSESTTVSEVKDTLLSPEVVDNGPIDFGYDKFAKNNITFVIDVSGSMKNNGKMELLRHSLFELVDNLRDQDQVSLVSYASKATVRLQTTSGANKNAIKDANISADDIHYINAHGTSTPLGDIAETRAIKTVFSDNVPAISSTKSMIGHTLGAAGAIESIFSIMSIQDGIIPPTINLHEPDPDCDLDYTPNTARDANIRIAMNNSFGFGGTNSSLVFSKI